MIPAAARAVLLAELEELLPPNVTPERIVTGVVRALEREGWQIEPQRAATAAAAHRRTRTAPTPATGPTAAA